MTRCLLALLMISHCLAASPDEDWAAIAAMDAGPKKKPASRAEALYLARAHFTSHKRLIAQFLTNYPNDPRAPDARMKFAGILAATGNMDGTQGPVDEAMRILMALEKSPDATSVQRADAGFRLASLYLQSMRGREAEMRSSIVDAARNFVVKYPGDRRGPRLLVEVATVCDHDPALKRTLLERARELSAEESLNHRIADDLLRLDLLGKPLEVKFPTAQGGHVSVAAQAGRVVILVFWSAESPACLLWLKNFRRSLDSLPKKELSVATVCLDTDRAVVGQGLKEFQMDDWPAGFDGLGWDSPTVRSLGINSLPTVIVLNRKGIVCSINARDNYEVLARRLLQN